VTPPTLLYVDATIREESTSRRLARLYIERWTRANPEGRLVHRDLAADPPGHITHIEADHFLYDPGCHSADRHAGIARCEEYVEELRSADLLLLAMPMHNFTVPSTFKAWVDHIAWPDYAFDGDDGHGLIHIPAVAMLARGGGYSPGAPKADWNFQDTYLEKVLEFIGITDVEFVIAELTAYSGENSPNPKLRDLAERSLAHALDRIDELVPGVGDVANAGANAT
jgi:FMN-dependent NADH-azoreductase